MSRQKSKPCGNWRCEWLRLRRQPQPIASLHTIPSFLDPCTSHRFRANARVVFCIASTSISKSAEDLQILRDLATADVFVILQIFRVYEVKVDCLRALYMIVNSYSAFWAMNRLSAPSSYPSTPFFNNTSQSTHCNVFHRVASFKQGLYAVSLFATQRHIRTPPS